MIVLLALAVLSPNLVWAAPKFDYAKEAEIVVNAGKGGKNSQDLAKTLKISENKKIEANAHNRFSRKLAGIDKLPAAQVASIDKFIAYGTPSTKKNGSFGRYKLIDTYLAVNHRLPVDKASWQNMLAWPVSNAEKVLGVKIQQALKENNIKIK